MALRTKTIEYAFPTRETSLAAATRNDFAAITLDIPENTSRTFRSVAVQITARQVDAVATALTSWLIGIKLGAVAFNDVTITDTIGALGEHNGWRFTRDVVSYFNTNFGSGTTQTCQVGVQFGAVVSINITAKLIITYEWDDASQVTRVKTVKIPLESIVGALTATLASIGTNQVPLLDTFCPEATKSFKNIWFEVFGNENNGGVTDANLALALDAEAEDQDGLHENALASSLWYYYIWVRNAMTTSATHDFKARVTSTVGFTFNHFSIILCATYTYDHSASTSILNSIQFAMSSEELIGHSVAADQSVIQTSFRIEEPATIALVQSGVTVSFDIAGAVTGLNVAFGSQADRAYTHGAGGQVCGSFNLTQRIDSGGAQGAGITLARGTNKLTWECYHTGTVELPVNLSAMVCLNYTSGKHANGDAVHNHTTVWSLMDTAADALVHTSAAIAPVIPEASYWVTALDLVLLPQDVLGTSVNVLAERLSGEGPADGWANIINFSVFGDPEVGVRIHNIEASMYYDRYPNDPDTERLAVETARKYRVYSAGASWNELFMYVTYHAITYAISGTISQSAGGTVQIAAYTKPTTGNRVLIDTTSRVGNGTYTITWYDNVDNVFVEARESATLNGRSDDGVGA